MPDIAVLGGLLAAISLLLHLRAEYRGPRWQVYLFKPLTTTILLIVALSGDTRRGYTIAVAIGLALSLAGDVFLMLPGDRFISGLIAFLLAHIAYIIAFSVDVSFGGKPLLLLPYSLVAAAVVLLLWEKLGKLRAPVLAYVATIVVMAWQAASRAVELQSVGATMAAVGAALFVVSDGTLAINRFRRHFQAAQVVIMATYVAAQWFIAASVN